MRETGPFRPSFSLTLTASGGLTRQLSRKDVLFDPPPGPWDRRPTPDSAMRPRARKWLEYRFGVFRRDISRSSSPAKAGDPVSQSSSDCTERLRRTGYPAFAGYDGGELGSARKGSNRTTALFDNLSEK